MTTFEPENVEITEDRHDKPEDRNCVNHANDFVINFKCILDQIRYNDEDFCPNLINECLNTNQISKNYRNYNISRCEALRIVEECTVFNVPNRSKENDRRNGNVKTVELTFTLANARSLAPKIKSWIDSFAELDLHFSLVTESWMRDGSRMEEDAEDLELGENIKLIHRNRLTRKKKKIAGGGVLIAYNKSKMSLTERKIRRGMSELVCASGRIEGVKRKIVIMSVYLPPKLNAQKLADALSCVSEAIGKAKEEFNDPIMIIGGDLSLIHI